MITSPALDAGHRMGTGAVVTKDLTQESPEGNFVGKVPAPRDGDGRSNHRGRDRPTQLSTQLTGTSIDELMHLSAQFILLGRLGTATKKTGNTR